MVNMQAKVVLASLLKKCLLTQNTITSHTDRYELVDVVMEAQDRFEAQIELQKLYAQSRRYPPADYKED